MEPTPPPTPPERRHGPEGGIFWGLIIVALGVYFLLRETLELEVPDLGRLWPIVVIAVGAWIVYQQFGKPR